MAAVSLAVATEASPQGVAAGAYTGLFAMPTTEVVHDGDLLLGFSSGESVRRADRHTFRDSNDNYTVLLGVLPNLEVGMSSLVAAPFNGMIEDRSVAAKLRVFNDVRSGFSLAIGSTDVQGTRLRATDYAIAAKRLGSAILYGGYGHGVLSGAMGGAALSVRPGIDLAAEYVGAECMAGVKARIGGRTWVGAAVGRDRRAFLSASYSIPLATTIPVTDSSSGAIADLATLVRLIRETTHGDTRVQVVGDILVVSYEDVEARDPVATFGEVMCLCSDYASASVPNLSITVRRFGRDLVTLRGATRSVTSFVRGWMSPSVFLSNVSIDDEGPATSETANSTQPRQEALVTFEPCLDYRLGLKDRFPNREWLRARGVSALPFGLIGVAIQDVVLNDAMDTGGVSPGPTLGIYRLGRLGPTWSAVGFDHEAGGEWFATGEVAYHGAKPDLRLVGSFSRSMVQDSVEPDRYAIEVGIDGMNGTATLWARHERFEVGDTGETVGLTRRFGRTEVAVTWTSTHEGSDKLRRAGITLRIPLPEARADLGGARLATASQAEFAYRPTESAEPSSGRGVVRRLPFTPEDDLTARGLLTAQMFRAQVSRMRRRL